MGRIRPDNIGTPPDFFKDRMPPRPPFPPRTPDRTPPRPPVPPRTPVGDRPRPPRDKGRPPFHGDTFRPPVPPSTVSGGGRDLTKGIPAGATKQVTLIDKETGVKYGGPMKYNPDTGKFDRMFKTPTREEFQRIKQQRDEMTNRRRRETSDFGSRVGRDGPATMDFRDSDGDGTDDRYQRGPGAPDSRRPVGRRERRRPPSSFSPISGGDRSRPENPSTFNPRDRGRRRNEQMMIERRERRDEQRARRREEMMRRRERGGFGGGFGREDRGPRRRRGPAVSTVDNATSRERPTSIDRRPSSGGGGGFLNRFVSTLDR